jgi:hypothetical protein
LALALSDTARPISVRAVADAVGVSPQTLYNHDSRVQRDGGGSQQLLPLIASAAERQGRIANRVKRRRGAKDDAVLIERLRVELKGTQGDYRRLLERWMLIEMNALAAGIDLNALLMPLGGKPDRSTSRAASRKAKSVPFHRQGKRGGAGPDSIS